MPNQAQYLLSCIKRYNLLFCAMLIALAIGILPLSYSMISLKLPINLLYTALVVFVLCNYKSLHLREFSAIGFPLVCLLIVIIMAFISTFWAFDSKATIHAIRQYLLEPSLFMIATYLIFRQLDEKALSFAFVCICLAVMYHPFATIYDFFANGNGKFGYYRAMLPRYYVPATVYVFYLLLPLGLSLASIFLTKKLRFRILSLALLCVSEFAIICNGGRFALLASLCMLCAPFVFFTYKRKRLILVSLFGIIIVGIVAVYFASAKWSERYNFYAMVHNFKEVWATPPAQMGKFTKACKDWAECSPYSLEESSNIEWEYSSLARISMTKSTILAIKQNPFRPNGYHFQQFPRNIQQIFPLDSINHPFSLITLLDGEQIPRHAHNHDYFLSLWFELGIIGLLGAISFLAYIFYRFYTLRISLFAYQDSKDTIRFVLVSGICFGLIGLIVSNFFDCIPVRDGQLVLFIYFGIFLALSNHSLRSDNNAK